MGTKSSVKGKPKMAKKSASSSNKRIHVISRDGGWAVKKEGNLKASKDYSTKAAAIKGAKRSSKGHYVVIHNKDGSIESIETTESGEQRATSFLRTARNLELQGPPDWSARLEEYLYDAPSERGG